MHTITSASLGARLALILIVGISGIQPSNPVLAAALLVTNTNDSGSGSLREAIADAASGDTITFDPSLAGQTITLASDLTIDKDLRIDGSGLAPQVIISGGNAAHMEVQNPTFYPTVTISDLTIADGYSSGTGGAIASNGDLTLINMTLRDNHAVVAGGALSVTTLTLKNTTIYRNQAAYGGAITMFGNGMSTIVNSTVTQNQASNSGGSLSMQGLTDVQVFNSTIAGNNAPSGTELVFTNFSILALYNSIVACVPESGTGCIIPMSPGDVISSHSIIAMGTPDSFGLSELADHGGPTHTMALLPGSPLLDAGDVNICGNDPVNYTDQRGAFRPQGEGCDIGAYEKDVPTYRVAPGGGSDPACGADWLSPCDLQYALTHLAAAGSQIWVMQGVYTPGTVRTATFQLVAGVEMYGGFAGTELLPKQRDPAAHLTVLSGDLLGNDNDNIAPDEPTRADNAYQVVTSSGADSETILDGFTITGGNANGTSQQRGGGMLNDLSSPNLTDLIFHANSAVEGGGIANVNSSNPTLTNVTIRENSASSFGGGMLNNNSNPILRDVTFRDNTAYAGGGVFNWSASNPVLTNVTFSGNAAGNRGGGMNNHLSHPILTNVTFSGNSALQQGGGMFNDSSNAILTHVTFSGNQAPFGGGIYNLNNSNPRIISSILYGNAGGEILNISGAPVVNYSIVQGGYPGIRNLDANPLLGPLQDNGGPTYTMALGAGSPARDAADSGACAPSDQRGVTRPQGAACDMGSYEAYDGVISAWETIRVPLNAEEMQSSGYSASISGDGRYVAFASRSANLVPGDVNGSDDVFVHDIQTGLTKCVSVNSNGTLPGQNGGSFYPSISADGRFIAFYSNASSLVPGDTNVRGDVFVHDMQTGITRRVSLSSEGIQGNGVSIKPHISSDGRYVAFYSEATNLVTGDTNAKYDIFVHDTQTSRTIRVSVTSNGEQANGQSYDPSISADGRYIVFASEASNLVTGDSNGKVDIFLYELQTGSTALISVSSNGVQGGQNSDYPSISADGRYIAFRSFASNLVPNDTNSSYDIFVRDVQSSVTTLVSVNSDGVQGNGFLQDLAISADGRHVAFQSNSTNLVADDSNGTTDIFVRDLQLGMTTRVSVASNGAQGNGSSREPSISADGAYIAFMSSSNNLVPGDTNRNDDVFVHRQNILPIPPPVTSADINVYIAGDGIANATVPFHSTERVSYAGINDGPVQIFNTNSASIMAAERVIYRVNGVNTSFSEMMGLPDSQLDTTYWLPWYNNRDLDTQLRFANAGGSPAQVHVFIGGVEMQGSPFTLQAGESTRKSFAGINAGPVKITSDQNIVVAERVIYRVNGINTSFTETMALPDSQLDTTYWLPWYNNVDLDTQLRFANVSEFPAQVRIYIGGVEMQGSPFTLLAGESTRKSFPGVNNGPVQIVSDQSVIVAERVLYRVNGINTSFSEMMGLPNSQLDTTYWLPWYNNKDLDTQLRFANTTNSTATVHVYVGGVEMQGSPFMLLPGESTRKSFPHINDGPVQIVSDVPIVAAERVIYKAAGGVSTSFSEMLALPNSQLDVTYWLPWYNNVDLDTQLRFGVP